MEQETSLRAAGPVSLVPPSEGAPLHVRDLEAALLHAFPATDAFEWDRTGMLVGFPCDEITGVAVALDPTIRAFEVALEAGANVLVTHHPLFLDAPESFLPAKHQGENPGSRVHFALSNHISCMSFHTACDVSVAGLAALPSMLRLGPLSPLEPFESDPTKGLGMVCSVAEERLDVRHLAARCVSVFGSHPRVWGNLDARIQRVCTFGGSASGSLSSCLDQGIDCLVCGEVKYHDALDAASSGLAIIELGHDVSELPLCAVLASEVVSAGIAQSCVTMVNQKDNWITPEATRR